MLTIQRYYKLCDKPIGIKGWRVDFCDETDKHYEIKLLNSSSQLSTKVYLQRKPSKVKDSENIYMFKRKDGTLTHVGVTASWIKDMNNLLKSLTSFTF
jgi:hypothetical protein